MLINPPCVVSLVWRLHDAQGQLIDELSDPVEFLVGGDDLLPKVEEALLDQEVGFETDLYLEPEHAFGDYDSEPRLLRATVDLPRRCRARHAVRRPAGGRDHCSTCRPT